jgi:hypothetical protein
LSHKPLAVREENPRSHMQNRHVGHPSECEACAVERREIEKSEGGECAED